MATNNIKTVLKINWPSDGNKSDEAYRNGLKSSEDVNACGKGINDKDPNGLEREIENRLQIVEVQNAHTCISDICILILQLKL